MIFAAAPIVVHPFSYPVGPLEVTGFGLAMFLGFVMAQIVVSHETARRGHDPEPIADLIFAAVIGGLLGAKLYYVALTRDPAALFQRAGFVYWGGLMGGIVAVLAMARWKRLRLWQIADVAGPAVMAAYAIGRTGCWAVGDDYGLPWDGPLAVKFPQGAPPSTVGVMSRAFGVHFPAGMPAETVVAVHPTQLYMTLLATVFFLVLWRLRDHRHAEGWLWGVFCALAGVERFIVEFFRAKDDRIFGGFTTAQVIALAFFLVGVAIMTMRSRVREGAAGIYARA